MPTMKDILERTRITCARTAWTNARTASALRHASNDENTKDILGRIKARAIRRAIDLAPERIKITTDERWFVGYPLVRWGKKSLHLPKDGLPEYQRKTS
jgi:hypothetical protein